MGPLFYRSSVLSTQDDLLSIISQNPVNFSAIYTFDQKKGRGQYGNSWQTAENLNVAFSLGVKVDSVEVPKNLFNYYTAILVRDLIANLTDKPVLVKWPNDIILSQKKIAGILIEKKKISKDWYYFIGIGINVLQKDFEAITSAGSILSTTGIAFNLIDFSEKMYSYLVEGYTHCLSEDAILTSYNDSLFRKNKVSVFEIEGTRQNGIIKKADALGQIWIELESGLVSFYHKEVKLLY